MKDYFGMVCAWYLNGKNKKKQKAQKKIQDKKLETAVERLKQLYEFTNFINEKCVRNRHERKSFWKNVSEGHPLVEETIINVLRKMGVKEESIKAITDAKINAIKQREDEEKAKKAYAEQVKKKQKEDKPEPTDKSNDERNIE